MAARIRGNGKAKRLRASELRRLGKRRRIGKLADLEE